MFFLKKHNRKEDNKRSSLQNPKILEVNLIKDEVGISFDWNKNLSVLVIVLFITSLFVAEIYFGLDWWEKQEILNAQVISEDIAQVSREISEVRTKTEDAIAYRDKTIEVTRLLDEHIYWSNFFSWLEKNTLNSVKFGSFGGDLTGIYSLDAKTKTFAEVSWQVKALLNDPLTKLAEVTQAASSASKGDDQEAEVSFTLMLEVSPEIFKK